MSAGLPGPGIGDEFELTIEKLVAGGDGFGRFDGLPVFVARAAPGELVRVRLWQRKRDFARAELVEILRASPDRREPPCEYFSRCGGCDLQHLTDPAQLRHKVAATRETLERLGGVEWPGDVRVVAGDAWAYRLRTQLHLESGGAGEPVQVGYKEYRSHRLVPVTSCPVLVPELERALELVSREAGENPPQRVDLAAGDEAVTLAPPLGGQHGGPVSRRIGEWRFWFDARCFFQAHAGLLPDLVEAVVGPWSGKLACDLYAGVGLFGIPLAAGYDKVLAVEGDRIAVRYHRRNLRENRVDSVDLISRAVESWIDELPDNADRVVVDPPRMGLGSGVRRGLLARMPRRLTYVSCHPAALARDLRELLQEYRLESLALLDLFPQTGHLEVVAQLASPDEAATVEPTLRAGG